tara:strand:+ start:264 stop:905 length:642 start_codon:yes stop_codon:yes gene_type:complete
VKKPSKFILAIHNTTKHFGFALREINDKRRKDKFFTKEFNRDLSNNLVFDLSQFISNESLSSVARISVSKGPANFNASRLVITLSRILAQQIKCPIDSYSSFQLIAKRMAIKNNIFLKNEIFWITKELSRRGVIAGKYHVASNQNNYNHLYIEELIEPKLFPLTPCKENFYEADFDINEELDELLELSTKNDLQSIQNSWEDVLPIYPLAPTN